MENHLVSVIDKGTAVLFVNLETTLNGLTDDQLAAAGSWGWPPAQQIFHLVRSMDQWFANPFAYMASPEIKSLQERILTRRELLDYYAQVKNRAERYLSGLADQELVECPPGSPFTRMELILGQYRHFMYHIGLIHGCIRSQTGHSPPYTGLGSNPPKRS